MIDLYSLFELAELRAIHAAIEPTMESIWRAKCRSYSLTYHTPLHVVMNELDPLHVLQTLNEEKYSPREIMEEPQEILEILYKMRDPNYVIVSQEETEALVDSVMNKELARAKKKKAPTQQEIQSQVKAAEAKPKSGVLDFGNLEQMESQAESNKAGFKD